MKRIAMGLLIVAMGCGDADADTASDATDSGGVTGASTSATSVATSASSTSGSEFTTSSGSGSEATATTTAVTDTTDSDTDPGVAWDCPEPRRAGAVSLIDDLETGGLPQVDGREGGWYVYNDGSSGTQWPADGIPRTDEDAHAGTYSARTHGEGFNRWGAALALAIQTVGTGGGNCPYDASAYEGITFWARGQDRIFFHITTMATAPVEEGGRCTVPAGCWDDFGTYVTLTEEWAPHTIPWDALAQLGWGIPAEFDPREILLLHWQDEDASEFDIWIDDLHFHPADDVGEATGSESGSSGSGGSEDDGSSSGDTTGEPSTGGASGGSSTGDGSSGTSAASESSAGEGGA